MLPFLVKAQTSQRSARPQRVAYLSASGTMISLWLAMEADSFVSEGPDVEVLSISSSLPRPVLIANELDAVQLSAAPVLSLWPLSRGFMESWIFCPSPSQKLRERCRLNSSTVASCGR